MNEYIEETMALFNGKVGEYYLNVLSPTINLQVGDVKNMPLLIKKDEYVEKIVNGNVNKSKADWDSFETSWDFKKHPMI